MSTKMHKVFICSSLTSQFQLQTGIFNFIFSIELTNFYALYAPIIKASNGNPEDSQNLPSIQISGSLSFFASWTSKSQKNFHGPLNYQSVMLVDSLNTCKRGLKGTVYYFCDLRGPPRPGVGNLRPACHMRQPST